MKDDIQKFEAKERLEIVPRKGLPRDGVIFLIRFAYGCRNR